MGNVIISINQNLPLGIRLNNPGNIEHGQPWDGLTTNQSHPRFCQFKGPQYGIRAIHKILQSYYNKYHLQDIAGMITRWAPPEENNTVAYIKDVAQRDNVAPDEPINIMEPATAFHVVTGIIAHENSNYSYQDDVVWLGLKLAGVDLGLSQ